MLQASRNYFQTTLKSVASIRATFLPGIDAFQGKRFLQPLTTEAVGFRFNDSNASIRRKFPENSNPSRLVRLYAFCHRLLRPLPKTETAAQLICLTKVRTLLHYYFPTHHLTIDLTLSCRCLLFYCKFFAWVQWKQSISAAKIHDKEGNGRLATTTLKKRWYRTYEALIGQIWPRFLELVQTTHNWLVATM